jgi:hypothetical protein
MENHKLSQIAGYKVIDWNRTEARAKNMTMDQLHYAALDCKYTADHGMPQDAGYYMDQASVYRREALRRSFTNQQ